MFALCDEEFTDGAFINGAGYKKKEAEKWQLLNFLLGKVKLARRKSQIEDGSGVDLLLLLISLVKASVFVDFRLFFLYFTTVVC